MLNDKKKKKETPIWEKKFLTFDEAAAYTGIGITRLRNLANQKNCAFVFWIGNKIMLKREKLEECLAGLKRL